MTRRPLVLSLAAATYLLVGAALWLGSGERSVAEIGVVRLRAR